MKYIKTLLALVLLGFSFSASAQCTDPDACNFNQTTVNDVCLSLETVQVHTAGALAGQTTYRLYVNFPADADYYIGAVSGSDGTGSGYQQIPPLSITTTTSFYQNEFGGVTPGSINPALYATYPDLEYDSWVTILGEDATFPKTITTLSDPNQPWDTEFEAGNDIIINTFTGGTWFLIGQTPQSDAPIGPSTSALIAQLTTDGDIDATVTVSYYTEASNDWKSTLSLSNACAFGACVYTEPNLNCDGTCINDTDADGICDEFEIVGCTDVTACNYNADATDSDQSLCNFSCKGEATSEGCNNEFLVNYNGYEYDLVEIDGICWFAEDLRTSLYNNNAPIDEVTDAQVWSSLTPSDGGKMTYFADGAFGQAYKSYNWYAVETGLLCPTGWHVANNSDWNSLEAEAFGARGQNLSSANNLVVGNTQPLYDLGWFSQYSNGNIWDETQFSGGLRTNVDGQWKDDDGSVYWWTAEDYTGRGSNGNRKNSAWARGVKKDASWGRYKDLWSTSNSKNNALRVRCVKGGVEAPPLVEVPDPFFFITPGPITDTTTVTDAQINAQDTIYIDLNGTTAPAGYFFANVRGERFMTDKNGILIPADNMKVRSGQKVFTVGDSDIIDSEIGIAGGGPLVTCACCCFAGSNSYLQEFTVTTRRSCGWWCNNKAPGNCEAFTWGSNELCMDDLSYTIAEYIGGQNGWSVKDQVLFEQILETVKFEIDGDLEVGAVVNFSVNEKAYEDRTSKITVKSTANFDAFKGFWFTFEDKVYRINDSFILEGGGDDPLPEWGAGPDDIMNVCVCWSDAPECAKGYLWDNNPRKNCSKICSPSSSTFPGSPPCNTPGGTAPDEDELSVYSKFGPIVKFNGDNPIFRNLNDAVSYGRAAGLKGIQDVVAPSLVYSEEADTIVVSNANATGFMAGAADETGFSFGEIQLEWSYDVVDLLGGSRGATKTFYGPSFITKGDKIYLDTDKNVDNKTFYIRQHKGSMIYKMENVGNCLCIATVLSEDEVNDVIASNPDINSDIIISDLDPVADKKWCTCTTIEENPCPDDVDIYVVHTHTLWCPGLVPCRLCCGIGNLIGKGGAY